MKAVEPGAVVVQKGKEINRIPFGTCIWTTGIRMHPLAERLADVRTLPSFLVLNSPYHILL